MTMKTKQTSQSIDERRAADNEQIVSRVFLIDRLCLRMGSAWPGRRLSPLERILLYSLYLNPWAATIEALEATTGASPHELLSATQNLVDWTLLVKSEQGGMTTFKLSMGDMEQVLEIAEKPPKKCGMTAEEVRAAADLEMSESIKAQIAIKAEAWELVKEVFGEDV